MGTIHDRRSFLHRFGSAHPIWRFPGISQHSFRLDTLHILDHHGVWSHIAGNILYWVVHDHELPGCRSKDAGIDAINVRLKNFNRGGAHNKLPSLKIANLIDSSKETTSSPILGGPGIKAANTKDSMPWILEIARETNDGSTAKHRRQVVAECAVSLINIMESAQVVIHNSPHGISQIKLWNRIHRNR